MIKSKFLSTLSLILSLSLASSVTAFAQDAKFIQTETEPESGITIVSDAGECEPIVSDVMTFDEMVEDIAIHNNKTFEEVSNELIQNYSLENINTRNLIRDFTAANTNTEMTDLTLKTFAATRATYRVLVTYFQLTNIYNPSLRYYCETDEWPGSSFRAINQILNVTLNTIGSTGLDKTFEGTIYTHLQTPNKIYYSVFGKFYNNGSSTTGIDITIPLGKDFSFSISGSQTTSYFCSIGKDGIYQF